jgi:hypothetical protein
MTFKLSGINHKSLNVDLDQELGFITSVVRCWVTTGRDYAQDQVIESCKRVINWLEELPDGSRQQIAKALLCLVQVVNSIIICIKDGAHEAVLESLGGLFINHMNFVLDVTRSFTVKREMESEVTLLSESKLELPSSYNDLNEQMCRIISRYLL